MSGNTSATVKVHKGCDLDSRKQKGEAICRQRPCFKGSGHNHVHGWKPLCFESEVPKARMAQLDEKRERRQGVEFPLSRSRGVNKWFT